MAELAILAFGAMASGGAAAGAAGAAGAVGAGISAATVLQGAATIGSVLMGVMEARSANAAGKAQVQEIQFQSRQLDLQTQREATASAQRADDLRRQALVKAAQARVTFGAAGLDMSSRQLDAIEGSLDNDLQFGLEMEKTNRLIGEAATGVDKTQLSIKAANVKREAKSQEMAGYIGAFSKGASGFGNIMNRK
jgi:hypothetical protein